jgi:flavin-dependent dehydrogenase
LYNADIMALQCDVLILGGGPAGSTAGILLKKYNPNLKVIILEREKFPRDHIGESQLPAIQEILHEMGVWDKVEAADFPIKIGATYRWGTTNDLWDFDFILGDNFKDEERPAKFKGQRLLTAFQVDRSIYDKILLDHAAECGCEVYEQVRATKIHRDGDCVVGVDINPGETALKGETSIEARYYIDATGNSGLLRRAMEVDVEYPTNLRNIALWDYWQNAEWAVNIGVGGTRIQVMSLDWGWIWFIPLSSTRTSIGLVTPVEYYKASGKKPEELYLEALRTEPLVSALTEKATPENIFQTTNDWSYIADRLGGENWFLAGDSCGFADPILSAGMTLAHSGARRVAYAILELDRGELDAQWIRDDYTAEHRKQVRRHIRFADFWYSSNNHFTDLKENCSRIAKEAGLELNANAAFQWLGTGGFTGDNLGVAASATFGLTTVKAMAQFFTEGQATWKVEENNVFRMNLVGAEKGHVSYHQNGRIVAIECYRRGGALLPLFGLYKHVYGAIARESEATKIAALLQRQAATMKSPDVPRSPYPLMLETWEAMITEGWVTAKVDKKKPFLQVPTPELYAKNKDSVNKIKKQASTNL